MALVGDIMLRMGMYKNRIKLNYLLASGRWISYYCTLLDENTLKLPKLRKNEVDNKMPKTLMITSKPCFDETNKIYEYHAIEGKTGTINWFGGTGSTEDKEDRRLITQAIEAGERIAKANQTTDLFGLLMNYSNLLPIVLLGLQIMTLVGIYVILNPA